MHIERATEQAPQRSPARRHNVADAATLVLERARMPGAAPSRGLLPDELRDAILRLCVLAHAEHMTIERLIVALKEKWAALPEVRRLPRGGENDAVLACVITQCILDFYSPGQHPESPSPMNRTRGESS
jgi:hypothetical protein